MLMMNHVLRRVGDRWWAGVGTKRPSAGDNHQQVLQVVQPALAGMMDGSVSTLAPLFATALATRNSHTAFLVGVAAAVGAGISMAFAEALSDDGSVTGRGNAWVRGPGRGRRNVNRWSGTHCHFSSQTCVLRFRWPRLW